MVILHNTIVALFPLSFKVIFSFSLLRLVLVYK